MASALAVLGQGAQQLLEQGPERRSLAWAERLEHALQRDQPLVEKALHPLVTGGGQPKRQRTTWPTWTANDQTGALEAVQQAHGAGMGQPERAAQGLNGLIRIPDVRGS